MSINVRRPPLSGRHLLAAEKSLTKFAISLGEGARTAPRAPTRKTGVCKAPPPAKARARQPPQQEKPQLRGPPPPPPCPRAHSRARAHSHSRTHNKRKRCEPRAELCSGAQGSPSSRPPRAAPGLLARWSAPRGPEGARIPEARVPPARPASPPLGRARRQLRRLWAHHARSSASRWAELLRNPGRASLGSLQEGYEGSLHPGFLKK